MSALSSLSGTATAIATAPAPAKPRARGFLHIVRHGVGPSSLYVLTYHRLESTVADSDRIQAVILPALRNEGSEAKNSAPSRDLHAMDVSFLGRAEKSGVILSEAKNPGAIDPLGDSESRASAAPSLAPEPARPKPILAEGAQALIDLLERIGVDFHRSEVRGALEDILRLGSANIPDLWLSDDDLLAKGLAES